MAEEAKFSKVVEIVRAMNTEGLSIADIRDSLKQIGVREDEIDGILKQASAEPTSRDIHDAVKMVDAKITQPMAKTLQEHKQLTEEVKAKVYDMSLGLEEHAQSLDQMSSSLDQHREKLDVIHETLQDLGDSHQELHEKVSELSDFSDEFSELKDILLDMRAMLAALKDLDNKILETNKEMLMRLKMK